MRAVACACLFLALVASASAGASNRKMLTLNGQQSTQSTQQLGYGRRYDAGSAQLAANNRAIVNTQLAINDAVNSGANPRVTEAAARYGNDQAYLATQSTRCGWWGRNWYGNCYGKKL